MKVFTIAKRNINKDVIIPEWASPLWDVHTHILPGVDDGAQSLEESVKMMEEEIQQGVTDLMLTPHFFSGKSDWIQMKAAFETLKEKAEELDLKIRLHLGAEIYYTAELTNELKNHHATLDHSDYVLVEFATDISYSYLKHALRDILSAARKPILAHVERYQCLMDNIERLEEIRKMGVILQVNANTLTEKSGQKRFIPLLQRGVVELIGSDCHRMDWRAPNIKSAITVLVHRLGKEKAEMILNAGRLLGSLGNEKKDPI